MKSFTALFTGIAVLVFALLWVGPGQAQTADADSMLYEVVQIDPDIGATPPTAQAGFGSTNGGALGWLNVQKFIRMDGNNGSNSIVGLWLSTGDNVAPLLVSLVGADSIWALFNADNTYLVTLIDTNGIVIPFVGTYVTSPSGVGNIWDITLNQSAPTVLTSQGIYEIFHRVTGIEDETTAPADFQLLQNYPNPFNPVTTIQFYLPQRSEIQLTVYNTLGQPVTVLANGIYEAGEHRVQFNAERLPSGIYFYELKAEGFQQTRKMLLVR